MGARTFFLEAREDEIRYLLGSLDCLSGILVEGLTEWITEGIPWITGISAIIRVAGEDVRKNCSGN